MATLKYRLDVMEAASGSGEHGGYLDFPPVMGIEEWCEAAAKQQAELIRETNRPFEGREKKLNH